MSGSVALADTSLAGAGSEPLSHNLLGQRLGRKGRGTRERILAATERMLADPRGPTITLSAVAREASLGMTTLYLYFADLTELLLAVLEPVMAGAEHDYLGRLRVRWPDDRLGAECIAFVTAFHAFWERHSRMLHLRNSHSEGDMRMVRHRVDAAMPLIRLMMLQMDGDQSYDGSIVSGMASAMVTGLERTVTVTTDMELGAAMGDARPNLPLQLQSHARLLELGIRHCRDQIASGAVAGTPRA